MKLNTVGTPTPLLSETGVKRADEPNVLEYRWGDGDLRWELEDFDGGTPLGRIVGPEAMKFEGWQRLNANYAKQFGRGI